MQARVPPTSPKVRDKQEKDVSSFYAASLQRLEKPQAARPSLLLIITVMVIGALAGALGWLGITVLHEQYPQWPLWTRVGIVRLLDGEPVTIRYVESTVQDEQRAFDALRKTFEAHVVEIYASSETKNEGLSSAFSQDARKGIGLILSNDGVLLAPRETLDALDGRYRLLTAAKTPATVAQVIEDPATTMRFAALQEAETAAQLRPATFARLADLFIGQRLLLYRPSFGRGGAEMLFTTIADLRLDPGAGNETTTILSSERIYPFVRLSSGDHVSEGAIVATFDGDILGFAELREGTARVTPLESVTRVLPDVRRDSVVDRPFLGVSYVDLATVALGNPGDVPSSGALLIGDEKNGRLAVQKRSPAAEAGLRAGDVITSFGGQELTDATTLSLAVLASEVGQTLQLTYLRDGQSFEASVTVGRLNE